MFSNSSKEIITNQFHARIPLINVPIAQWINLSIDVISFVSDCFKSSTFRSIDYISITANSKVRRIFSMRNSLNETNQNLISDDLTLEYTETLPRNLCFPNNINFSNLNYSLEKLRFEIGEYRIDTNSGFTGTSNQNGNTKLIGINLNNNYDPNQRKNILSPKAIINNNNNNNNKSNSKKNHNNSRLKNYENKEGNNKNLDNSNNQTNGISNYSIDNIINNNNGNNKNMRAKSHPKPLKNKANAINNDNSLIKNNNEEDIYIKNENENYIDNSKNNNNNNKNNLKKNLFDKNKNKMKYNIPIKINKIIKGNSEKIIPEKKNGNLNINSLSNSIVGKIKEENITNNQSIKKKIEIQNNSNINNHNNNNIKNNKQSNGLSKNNNNNEFDFKTKGNSLLLNTLNYKNIDTKWENRSQDNYADSIEEIYEIEER
jgi:hypothetical protein